MPIVFIHGVNTRIDESYHPRRLDRAKYIETLLRPQLPKPFSEMKVEDPFWGDDGATTGSSVLLPRTSGGAEAMGAGGAALVAPLPLEEIVDTLLLCWGDQSDGEAAVEPEMFEAVVRTLWALRLDGDLSARVAAARSRDEAISIVEEVLIERMPASAPPRATGAAEAYGWGVKAAIGGALKRLFTSPYVKRPVSMAVASNRAGLHSRFALFFGDVFVYLKERGTQGQPGPIIEKVLAALKPDGEPVLAITHSMGGNIFYDVVTHFAPTVKVAGWMSVGGQVGFLEYQRLFLGSAKGRFTGQKVEKPIAGPWLNVFDPIDPFAFLAEPVFNGVKDFEFVTGSNILNAHGDYFIREDFYERAGKRLAELLTSKQ